MDEIDKLFSTGTRGRRGEEREEKERKAPKAYDIRGSSIDDTYKYTKEGYKIYKPEELKMGRGGGSDLCPFDCECCY